MLDTSIALRRVTVRAVLALVLAFAAVLTGSTDASADESAVTWSVQPATASGPDGRAWIERTLDPGESTVEHLAVRNFSDHDVVFRLTAADGFFNENGRFNILPSDQESVAAGTWIDIPDAVTVGAGATVVVAFTVTVPEDAEPGDHAAGVAASILTSATNDGGASVGVESRVGFRVMTRVTGELQPDVRVSGITTSYRTSWNPFAPGSATVEFDVENSGNARLRVEGAVEASGQRVAYPPDENPQELLAGDARHFRVEIDDVWPLFAVPVSIEVDPTVIVVAGEAPEFAPIRSDATAAAIPWPQLTVVLGVGLLVWALVWNRIRSRRRIDDLVARAREEGRRESVGRNAG